MTNPPDTQAQADDALIADALKDADEILNGPSSAPLKPMQTASPAEPGVSDEQDTEDGMPEEEAAALLAAALDYARRGLAVLPLHTVDSRGRCTCGKTNCPSQGKHPMAMLVPNGVENATTDVDTIRAWWKAAPYANVGVATGRVSGMSALDVDPGRGGNDSLAQAIREHGETPQTPTVESGSGGRHFWFKHPDTPLGGRKDFLPGLELKTDGGYVVAAPSRHKSGKAYRWLISPEDAPLAEMPEWLRKVGEEARAASTSGSERDK